MTPSRRLSQFRRAVAAARATELHLDRTAGTGRNADASWRRFDDAVAQARALLAAAARDEADSLPEYLDSTPGRRLAETFNHLERRYAGLTLDRLT